MRRQHLRQRCAHRKEADTWPCHITTDGHELVPDEPVTAQSGPPIRASIDDADGVHERLDVVDQGRLAVEPLFARKGRLVSRFAAAVFHAFEQCRLLAEDVAAWRDEDVDVEIEAAAEKVLPQRADGTGACDLCLEAQSLGLVLVTDEDRASLCAHAIGGQRHAFEHEVRQVVQQLAVLECTGLTLVGVAHDVLALTCRGSHE